MGVLEALALARRGFRVFPLARNSNRPAFAGWIDEATADAGRVVDLFCTVWDQAGAPHAVQVDPGYNVGVLTDGMLVVDVDVKKGREGWASFQRYDPDLLTFTVETRSGGRHYYYDTAGASFSNTAGTLGEGLDTRSWHGYVVGPGSVIDGQSYKVICDPGDLAFPPVEMMRRLSVPKQRTKTTSDFAWLDDPRCIHQATTLLENAPGAFSGEQSTAAFDAAARVRDCGVSEGMCLNLMLDYWNERCEPPLSFEDLERRVRNAYTYATGPLGGRSPLHEFAGVQLETIQALNECAASVDETEAARGSVQGQPGDDDRFGNLLPLGEIKARPWLVKDLLLSGQTTLLSAAGGTGKTNFILTIACLLAAGREDILGFRNAHAGERVASIIHTVEDGLQEVSRRTAGICAHYGLNMAEVYPHIHISTERGLYFAGLNEHGRPAVNPVAVKRIAELTQRARVGFIALDPLANLHTLNENDAAQMNLLVNLFNEMAERTGAAIMLVHHTSKLADGSIAASRGSTAIVGAVRTGLVLTHATDSDALEFGIPRHDLPHVICMGDGKPNWSERTGKRRWFILRSAQVRFDLPDKVGVPCVYEIEQKLSAADHRVAQALRTCMAEKEKHALTYAEATAYLRNPRNGESIFLAMSDKQVADHVRQLIRRVPDVLETNGANLIVPADCGDFASIGTPPQAQPP